MDLTESGFAHHRVMITGSRGFLGRAVGRACNKAGATVLGISRSERADPDWVGEHHHADVATDDLASVIVQLNPTVIVHAAGSSSVGSSFDAPLNDLKASVVTWANVLNSVRTTGLDPLVVFISSAAVYGSPGDLPVAEDAPRNPLSPYGWHKGMCEFTAEEYARCFSSRVLVTRLFSVLGPEQRRLLPWEVFSQLTDPMVEEVTLEGSADATRDYLFVDDAAEAILSAAHVSMELDAGTTRYVNIASGLETSVGELANLLRQRVAPKPVRFLERIRPGDPQHWRADISRLRELVPSWQPIDLGTALDRCVSAWGT